MIGPGARGPDPRRPFWRSARAGLLAGLLLCSTAPALAQPGVQPGLAVLAGPGVSAPPCAPPARPAPRATPAPDPDPAEPPGPELLPALGVEVQDREPAQVDTAPTGPLRIGLWGDSHSAARFVADAMIEALGIPPGEAIPSLLPAAVGLGGVRLAVAASCKDGAWTYRFPYGRPPVRTGLGLTTMTSAEPGSRVWIDFAQPPARRTVESVTLHVGPWEPQQAPVVAISADGGAESVVDLKDFVPGPLRITPDRPVRSLGLRLLSGTLTLEGFEPAFTTPGRIIVDTFGIPGARARIWRGVDADDLRARLSGGRDYDLVVFAYGTNEGNAPDLDLTVYRGDLRRDLQQFRAVNPRSVCVLAGPPDRGVLLRRSESRRGAAAVRQKLLRYGSLHARIAEVQREVSAEFGCSFWDWQAAMGGPGGIYRWYHASPRLASRDLIHLTPEGYRRSGRKLAAHVFAELAGRR